MKIVALDIESTGLFWNDRVLGVGAAWGDMGEDCEVRSVYWPIGHADLFNDRLSLAEVTLMLDVLLRDADWVVCHNGSFDLPRLFRHGLIDPQQLDDRFADTMILARSTGSHESVSLLNTAKDLRLSPGIAWEKAKSLRGRLEQLPVSDVAEYCRTDCEVTLRIARRLLPLACDMYGEEWVREDGNFPVLVSVMTQRGQQLDLAWISRTRAANRDRVVALVRDWLVPHLIKGPNDRDGILGFLTRHNALPRRSTPGGATSTDEEALFEARQLLPPEEQPILDAVLECRHLEKQESTWLLGLLNAADADGRVHGGFTAGGAVSYRLTCDNPNMQAIPKTMRVLRPGVGYQALLALDYSQAELRIAAMYAGESAMARMFQEAGTDIHLATAALMFGEKDAKARRSDAKRCNFGAIYGGGARAIAEAVGVDEDAARALIASHKKAFPRLYSVAKDAEKAWKERGFLVLCSGRRLYASAEDLAMRPYKAFNQLIQGSVAEMMRTAMREMHRHNLRIVSQVHDEIKIEVPERADLAEQKALAIRIMEEALPQRVRDMVQPAIPMVVDCTVITGGDNDQ